VGPAAGTEVNRGSKPDGGATLDSNTAEPGTPAARPATKPNGKIKFPTVESAGGPVIANPKVVPVVFANDAMASDIATFTAKIGASAYWKNVGAEYGVGPMTAGEMITIAEPPPATMTADQVSKWVTDQLSGTSPTFGTPDPNTLYAVFYPSTTTIATGSDKSCQAFGGYHDEVSVDGKAIGYAMLARCTASGMNARDTLTVAASHEYFEWATDPFPRTDGAFQNMDDDHWAWGMVMQGEVSDLCTQFDKDNLRPAEIGFTVQRHWSNKASLLGQYPCAPVKAVPYVQTITDTPDEERVPNMHDETQTTSLVTKAIHVAPGKTRTVSAFVYSDQPADKPVEIRAISLRNGRSTGAAVSAFTFSVDTVKPTPGDTVQVTIQAAKSIEPKDAWDILIMGTLSGSGNRKDAYLWPVLVTTGQNAAQATASSLLASADVQAALRSFTAHTNRGPRLSKVGASLPNFTF
jgi:hypothetical protein